MSKLLRDFWKANAQIEGPGYNEDVDRIREREYPQLQGKSVGSE